MIGLPKPCCCSRCFCNASISTIFRLIASASGWGESGTVASPWHFLNFFPLPHGHGSLRPTLFLRRGPFIGLLCILTFIASASLSGERALAPALPLFHSLRNSFHSATPWALRRWAVTGSSFGARGTVSSLRPASCGRRSALRWFTSCADQTRFSHESAPPRERGTTWSRLPSSGCSNTPVYWQRLPSRSRMLFALSFGRFFGTFAKFNATITVGTRIAPRTVCTALSPLRTGSVIHSSHFTGRICSSPSMSSAVATFVAIWQNASCGVRMLIACQLRLSTNTIVLFITSFIKSLHTATAFRALRCLFFVETAFSRLWKCLSVRNGRSEER